MRVSVLFTILYVLIALNAKAQPDLMPRGTESEQPEPEATKSNIDTTIVFKMHSWKLTDQYSQKEIAQVDSSTINFHRYDLTYRNSISNNNLGHVGAPYQSNIFFQRAEPNHFYFNRSFGIYAATASQMPYFNTTKTFSSLTYYQNMATLGGPEQVFTAFLNRNIDPSTNFGFRFHVNKTTPEYKSIEANHRYLNAFVSRNSERYNGYFSIINGSNFVKENGGLATETINTNYGPDQDLINLIMSRGIDNKTASLSAFTSHEYLVGKTLSTMDQDSVVTTTFTPQFSGQYTAEYEQHQRNMKESYVDTFYFANTYISLANNHSDSILFKRFAHMVQLKAIESTNRKFTFGARAYLQNEIISATHPVPYGYRRYNYSNLNLGGAVYRHESDFWKWTASGNLVILGRNLGDAQLKGEIEKPFVIKSDSILLKAEAWYRDISADIFEENLISNHYRWSNNFKKQHDVVIKGTLRYDEIKLRAGANYSLLSNYLYNNLQGMPDQYASEFSVFNLWLKKDFVFWRFGWENHVEWQQTSDQAVLRLPALSAYSSFYYSHYLFKVMKIQLGAEVYYNTPFYANAYNPATTQFHLQDEVKIGGFPIINAFVNAKLKRTSAFVKLTHANSYINGNQFFMAPKYPLGQLVGRFGFYWTFYD